MLKIVMNGCFDLFHEGHKDLLHKALKFCSFGEVLILVNSDKSVKKLKGKHRPHDNQETRVQNLEDAVLEWTLTYLLHEAKSPEVIIKIFDTEKELEQLIDEFEPDIIMKGNDRYDVREIVGHEKWPVLMNPCIQSTTNLARQRGLE